MTGEATKERGGKEKDGGEEKKRNGRREKMEKRGKAAGRGRVEERPGPTFQRVMEKIHHHSGEK